jgi:acyl-homoserine lactone acylase PvdQ
MLASHTINRLLLGFAASLLLVAAPASARVIQATSSLPPGESGFVSLAGLGTGTGSPHLYDQQRPFINFDRKNAMLGQRASTVEKPPLAGVTIRRDAWGVPSVTGASTRGLWQGAGWATAEDRLTELEFFRHSTEGRLSELLGPSDLASDIVNRRDFYTTAELARMLHSLPQAMQQRFTDYDQGVNAYVDYVNAHPTLIPGEFTALGMHPTHFTVEDLAAIGVYLARTTPNGDGADIPDMEAIKKSGPRRFNKILPLRIRGQISTVPARDGRFPSVPGRTRRDERAALTRSYRYLRGIPVPPASSDGTTLVGGKMPSAASARAKRAVRPIHVGGSYMVAVKNPRTHRAILFNGPELGFSAPEELYEMELHGPGVDVRGVTVPGLPVVAIGHNAHIAFGLTSGLSQTNALYVERLVPGHPDEYYFKGRIRQMSCRDATFVYGKAPGASVTRQLCRTNEGPVQARVGGYAFSRRYATWFKEMNTLAGLAAVDSASSVRQVNRALAKVTWNENMMAVDDHGNIGYWHPGLLPIRPKNWDERLPYPGNGSAQWHGFLPVARRPHVINPRQHFLENWNTLPSQGWTTGNDPASERLGGPFFRGAFLNQLAKRLARHPTFAGMDALIKRAGSTAQQRPLAGRKLRAALKHAKGHAAVVLRTILGWNGGYTAANSAGTVAPGVQAWQDFKDQLTVIALRPLGAAGELIGGGEPNSEHLFDATLGQTYAMRTLGAAGWRRAAAAAYTELDKQFGTSHAAAWRAKRTLAPESTLGLEQPPPMPFFDRGTFEEVTELGR